MEKPENQGGTPSSPPHRWRGAPLRTPESGLIEFAVSTSQGSCACMILQVEQEDAGFSTWVDVAEMVGPCSLRSLDRHSARSHHFETLRPSGSRRPDPRPHPAPAKTVRLLSKRRYQR